MSQDLETQTPSCANCGIPRNKQLCRDPENGVGYKGCPTQHYKDALAAANAKYDDPAVMEFARQASLQEAEGYANRHQRPYVRQPCKTRIVEICEFAERMGYKKLGLAFCAGLINEAELVGKIFKARGFELVSVICKAGGTPKEFLGLNDKEKVYQDQWEPTCNPVYQAELLNRAGCDFNVLLGLCVGHDSLFFMNAKAPTTVLAVKDRVTGHNPLAAVYLSEGYYGFVKSNPGGEGGK